MPAAPITATRRARWLGADYRLTWTGIAAHTFQFGAEGQWNEQLFQRNFDVNPYVSYLDKNRPSHTFGVFAQDEWRFRPLWLLNAGLRYDKHSDYVAIASPRLALIYQPEPGVALKALGSGAYRAPNAYERYYDDGGILQKANPGLQPEKIHSVELAADIDIGNAGRLGVSAYHNWTRHLIDQVTSPVDGLLVYANVPQIRAHGLEVEVERKWPDGTRLRGSVAWQHSQMADDSTLVNSPRLLGKFIFATPLVSGWHAAAEWLAMSERRTLAGTTGGFGLLNLTVSSTRVVPIGEFSIGIYNLGDRCYADPGSPSHLQDTIEQDRRQFRLRWTVAL